MNGGLRIPPSIVHCIAYIDDTAENNQHPAQKSEIMRVKLQIWHPNGQVFWLIRPLSFLFFKKKTTLDPLLCVLIEHINYS